MKKNLLVVLIAFLVFISTGCSRNDEKSVIKDLEKKVNRLSSYKIEGDLEIVNNDEIYNYKVESSFKKDDNYKVRLTNTSNDYEQIILRNNNEVYVLTPSLNKSFKFQSDWPNSASQIYLLKSIIDDIKDDEKKIFKKNKNGYTFIADVNYPNNKKLVKQKIVFDKDLNLKSVKVYNNEDVPLMTFKVTDIDYSPTFKNSYFKVNETLKSSTTKETSKEVNVLENSIYPLSLPKDTKLVNEEKIEKTGGNRIIMTFDGEKPFLLVEETANKEDEMTIVPTYGEPYMLMDTVGAMTNNSLTWTTGGIDYYIVSDVMNQNELLEIAESITSLPTMK